MNKIENLFVCEKLFYTLRDMDVSKMNIVDRGVRTFYLYSLSFMGKGDCFSHSYDKNFVKTFFNKKQVLMEFKEKFKHIGVINKDYRKVLELIKNKTNIMLYADPPYFGTEYMYKNITFTNKDHEILAEYLNNAKYSVMVSYQYFDGIYDLYPKSKWRYIEICERRSIYSNKHGMRVKKAKELLIVNYDIPQFLIGSIEEKNLVKN